MKDDTAVSVWFTGKKSVEIREETVSPKPGEIIVYSKLIGISHGTEMLFYRGDINEGIETDASLTTLSGSVRYPVKYGYINVGMIGSQKAFIFYPHQTAFFIKKEEAILLPDRLSFEDAVFLAHMETAVGIVQDTNPAAGDSVLVLGQGTIGLLVSEVLRTSHTGTVITVDSYAKRRLASESIGCTALSATAPDAGRKITELTKGRGPDCAINVSGSPFALQLAIDTVCFEGIVVDASWYGSRPVSLDLGTSFHRKRLMMKSSQVSTVGSALAGRWDKKRRLEFVLSLLGRISPSKYITHRFPIGAADKAFGLIENHPEDVIQVVLQPEEERKI